MIQSAELDAVQGPVTIPVAVPHYRVARSAEDRLAAFRLVYRSYLQSGLCKKNRHGLRVTPYHLLPTTCVFGAFVHGEIISTMTLIGDGELGLPMESMYAEQVQRRRDAGLRVGEVSCLADRRTSRRQFFEVFLNLSRLMAQFARFHGLDQLLVVVHPKHARFYVRYLGFVPMGGLTECPHVENKPAVALCLDFARVDCEPPECYDTYFGVPIAADQLQAPIMSEEERRRLRQVVDDCFERVLTAGDSVGNDGRFCTV